MKNKLTELIKEAMQYADNRKDIGELYKPYEEYIAEYLIDNNTIVTPCKVGDKVFYVHEICDEDGDEYLDISVGEVVSFSMQKEGLWAYCRYEDGLTYWHLVADDFGKTVFLSKEEAEKALKGEGK
jgi:hypothetical protein